MLTNEHVDVVTFTGSADTAAKLRTHPNVVRQSIPFNAEADSLNCAILAPDVTPDDEEFDLFVKEVAREMTTKAGQKCTAIRRAIVPRRHLEAVAQALRARLAKTVVGDPALAAVRMGALASHAQLSDVAERVALLQQGAETVCSAADGFAPQGEGVAEGAFFAPTLLLSRQPLQHDAVHDIEAFGPVSTLMAYDDLDEAMALAARGRGSLVGTLVTRDPAVAARVVPQVAAHHGRMLILDREAAAESTGHGSPLPMLKHGGPGRAGGGEELGGIRAVKHYLQRTAVQGSPTMLAAVTGRTRIVLHAPIEVGHDIGQNLDARTGKPLPLPKLPAADHVLAGAASADGRYQTLGIDTGTAPQASWVHDWKTGKATRWVVPSAPEVDLSRFVRATLESYPARDGTRIPMFVRRPARCAAPCPVVVEFHGGPEAQAQPGFSPYAQMVVDAGFVLVEPNVRGSDGYGKAWFHADDGPRRLSVITDIEDCARFIRKEWAVDGKEPRIGIVGGSYGGYSALVGMTMFAGAYDAGVSIVGMSNLVSFLQNTAPYRRALRVNEYGDPANEKEREALVRLSPTTYVDRVKGPLLIIQGANDPRAPAGEAVQIHEALVARGVPSRLILFADEGHGTSKRSNQVLELGNAIRFLQETLGAGR